MGGTHEGSIDIGEGNRKPLVVKKEEKARAFTQEEIVRLTELRDIHGIDIEEYVKRPAILTGDNRVVERTNPVRIPDEQCILFEVKPKLPKVITTVRRFVITKEINTLWTSEPSRHYGIQFRIGDILEERFDMPNNFVNITRIERRQKKKLENKFQVTIQSINRQQQYPEKHYRLQAERGRRQPMNLIDNPAFGAFEPMEDVEAKDSEYFRIFGKKAVTAYKRKRKQLATINEEITNLRGILEIEDED